MGPHAQLVFDKALIQAFKLHAKIITKASPQATRRGGVITGLPPAPLDVWEKSPNRGQGASPGRQLLAIEDAPAASPLQYALLLLPFLLRLCAALSPLHYSQQGALVYTGVSAAVHNYGKHLGEPEEQRKDKSVLRGNKVKGEGVARERSEQKGRASSGKGSRWRRSGRCGQLAG